MAANLYGKFVQHLHKADVDFDTATFKGLICQGGYVPDFDAHEFRSSVTNEVTGTGYTAGGVALTGVAVTVDAAANRVKVDANDIDFGTVTFTSGTQIIIYLSTGSAATDILVGRWTFATTQSPTGAPFQVVVNADGLYYGSYGTP